MARQVASLFEEGWVVNLGIGLPTRVADYIPQGLVLVHSENGILGVGPRPEPDDVDTDLVNAGKQYVTAVPGASFFSQAESFAMIRRGVIDAAVMGAFQVSESGDLANWKTPAQEFGSIGGAMDLVMGAQRVIVLMRHTTKEGLPKLVRRCTYPLTGKACVARVVTELGVFGVGSGGLRIELLAEGVTEEMVRERTEARLE